MDLSRPFSIVKIPSKGLYYKSKKDFFLVRFISSVEEDILSDAMLMDDLEGVKIVLKNLIIDDDFDVNTILAGDVQAIGLFIRSTAYGDDIEISLNCPHCKHKEQKDFKISEFKMREVKNLPEEGKNFISTTLPASQKEVKIKILSFFEEMKSNKENKNFTHKLSKCIISFGETTDFRRMPELIEKMPMADSKYLRKFLEENTPGVFAEVEHECTSCSKTFIQKINSDYSFLKLPEKYKENILEERFLLTHYNEGGITWDETAKMSTTHRKWLFKRLKKELMDKKSAEDKKTKRITRGSRKK